MAIVFPGPTSASPTGEQKEVDDLKRQALKVCVYLNAVLVATFFAGAFLLVRSSELARIAAVAMIGTCGSAVAALTSCLNRYANGYELRDGTKVPPPSTDDEKKETFNERMASWFVFRPALGLAVAPAFIWGLGYFVKDSATVIASTEKLGFFAFMAGLLAKSVIDLIKRFFKSLFKV